MGIRRCPSSGVPRRGLYDCFGAHSSSSTYVLTIAASSSYDEPQSSAFR
jgi:hypothetical protein